MNDLLLIILHLTLYTTIMLIDVKTDVSLFKTNGVNHFRGALLRIGAVTANIIALKFLYPFDWLFSLNLLALEFSIWWIAFDIWVNLDNNQTPIHVGGAGIDKFFSRFNYGDYWMVAIKWFAFGIALRNIL